LRAWVFRGLILIVVALIIVSWLAPWWTVSMSGDMFRDNCVVVYPYGIYTDLAEYVDYIAGYEMPVWFGPFMWTYLGIAILLLLFSMFARDKRIKIWKINGTLPSWIIGLVGFSYIVVVIAAVVTITLRAADFYHMKLLEPVKLSEHPIVWATGTLKFNYWLACALGPLLIILALLRNKITGKKYD
jgi:hypothetical protein